MKEVIFCFKDWHSSLYSNLEGVYVSVTLRNLLSIIFLPLTFKLIWNFFRRAILFNVSTSCAYRKNWNLVKLFSVHFSKYNLCCTFINMLCSYIRYIFFWFVVTLSSGKTLFEIIMFLSDVSSFNANRFFFKRIYNLANLFSWSHCKFPVNCCNCNWSVTAIGNKKFQQVQCFVLPCDDGMFIPFLNQNSICRGGRRYSFIHRLYW